MYHFICRHRNDGLYDFVLFVRCSKQEISERAVQHQKIWCFNVPVVHFNLLFLLLFGTFWRTLGTSRTPDQKFAINCYTKKKKKKNRIYANARLYDALPASFVPLYPTYRSCFKEFRPPIFLRNRYISSQQKINLSAEKSF